LDVAAVEKDDSKQGAAVFHELLQGSLPDSEKSFLRLAHEAQTIVGAGTETTAWTLAVITAYLLVQPATLRKLREALNPVSTTTLAKLEQIPYLNAVLLEGLRLSYGLGTRLPRVTPDETLHLKSSDGKNEFYIPPGTPIGMTSVLVHHNPQIFPEPLQFKPERWLDEQNRVRTDLQKYLLTFSKGSRQCLGIK
jgi:cytochrome P450